MKKKKSTRKICVTCKIPVKGTYWEIMKNYGEYEIYCNGCYELKNHKGKNNVG